jgi:hypothetical protein
MGIVGLNASMSILEVFASNEGNEGMKSYGSFNSTKYLCSFFLLLSVFFLVVN